MTGAERIAAFAHALRPGDLPADVARAARLHLLDAVGVGIAAAAGPQQAGWAAVAEGDGPATTLAGGTAAAAEAAMLNGALIHSLEYDDTHTASVIHGSAVAAPVALAAAEAHGADGAALLTAYVVAWEAMIRIGLAAPGAFQARGFQVTAVAGAIGAAAAAGRMAGLSPDSLTAAIGIAGSQASGLLAFLEDGSSVKALNPGWAARTGLTAAALARAGMTGPARILESRFGVMTAFGADPDHLANCLDDLGRTWHLPDAAFKLYPCCHYIHPFLEALERLIDDGLDATTLDGLTAHVPAEAAPLIAEPWDRRQAPASGYDGKWGLAYCLALRLVEGRVDVASFETPPRAATVALARRMDWAPWHGSGFPARFPARLDARLRDGRTLSAEVETVRGGGQRPVDEAEVMAKFRRNAERRLSGGRADAVAAAIMGPDTAPDLRALRAALRG